MNIKSIIKSILFGRWEPRKLLPHHVMGYGAYHTYTHEIRAPYQTFVAAQIICDRLNEGGK
jgi:hypothetical protein